MTVPSLQINSEKERIFRQAFRPRILRRFRKSLSGRSNVLLPVTRRGLFWAFHSDWVFRPNTFSSSSSSTLQPPLLLCSSSCPDHFFGKVAHHDQVERLIASGGFLYMSEVFHLAERHECQDGANSQQFCQTVLSA